MRDRLTVRLPTDLLAAIDAHRRTLTVETCLDVTRTDAVTALVRRGLDSLPPSGRPSGLPHQPEPVAD